MIDYDGGGITNWNETEFNFVYVTELLELAWYGNNPYVGKQMDLSATWVNTDHFNSWYVAYAFPIGKIVEMGVRLNLNQGIFTILFCYATHENNGRR